MVPHPASSSPCFLFDVLVSVAVRSDRVPLSDEPFPNILTITGHDTECTPIIVVAFNLDMDGPSANPLRQSSLDTASVVEPAAFPILRNLVPLRRVESDESYFLPGHKYSIAIGDSCPAGNGLSAAVRSERASGRGCDCMPS